MRTKDASATKLIMMVVLISMIQLSHAANGQAGVDVPGTEKQLKAVKMQISPLIALPDYKEMDRAAARGLAHNGTDHGRGSTGGPIRLSTLGHLVISHVGIITRPVSAIHKLLALLYYTGHDSTRNALLVVGETADLPPVSTGAGMDLTSWEEELDRITGTRSSSGKIKFLVGGEEFYSRLTDSIMGAEESVHMRVYIYDNDDYATGFAEILKSRSRDVEVLVLSDGMGTLMANGVHPDSMPEDHRPSPSVKELLTKDSEVKFRFHKNLWLTLDHSKTIIVDRKTAFIGGMNIGREYRYHWQDLMMEVNGPVVNTLQDEFNISWAYAGIMGDLGRLLARKGSDGALEADGDYPIRVLQTKTGDSQIYKAHMAAIRKARRYIYIENPYLSDDAILMELINARRRGVDVRVVVPDKANWHAMDRSNRLVKNVLMENGIKVYLYPRMTHVKAAVIDGWSCVGSANLDKASFRTNQEVNLSTSEPAVARRLIERLFEPDFKESHLMNEETRVTWIDHLYELWADQL